MTKPHIAHPFLDREFVVVTERSVADEVDSDRLRQGQKSAQSWSIVFQPPHRRVTLKPPRLSWAVINWLRQNVGSKDSQLFERAVQLNDAAARDQGRTSPDAAAPDRLPQPINVS